MKIVGLIFVAGLLLRPAPVRADPDDAFATAGWRYQAAAIVAAEAPADCDACNELTACQIIRDARIDNPWLVVIAGPGRRWHGSRPPQLEHLQAVSRMLSNGCDKYPSCFFLGSERDLGHWRQVYPGLVREIVGFCSARGCSICVVKQPVKLERPRVIMERPGHMYNFR